MEQGEATARSGARQMVKTPSFMSSDALRLAASTPRRLRAWESTRSRCGRAAARAGTRAGGALGARLTGAGFSGAPMRLRCGMDGRDGVLLANGLRILAAGRGTRRRYRAPACRRRDHASLRPFRALRLISKQRNSRRPGQPTGTCVPTDRLGPILTPRPGRGNPAHPHVHAAHANSITIPSRPAHSCKTRQTTRCGSRPRTTQVRRWPSNEGRRLFHFFLDSEW
jgi:hypothetical protein